MRNDLGVQNPHIHTLIPLDDQEDSGLWSDPFPLVLHHSPMFREEKWEHGYGA
jgi:hypothetical protein